MIAESRTRVRVRLELMLASITTVSFRARTLEHDQFVASFVNGEQTNYALEALFTEAPIHKQIQFQK